MNFGHIKNIHFVGIGGIGMSGIAEILSNYDLSITGCDARSSAVTERLVRNGIDVSFGHSASHIDSADLLVVSSAVRPENVEVRRARDLKVPVIRRAEMLGEIMRLKRGVAIAGTHGKTTTSAMAAMVLAEAGLDPTLIIGGILRNLDTSARLGTGEFLVVEADEYDRSFLTLHPNFAVITNIEADHLDCYRDLDDIRQAFAEFAKLVPFYGLVIGCVDDENVASLLDSIPKRSVRYGLGPGARVRAVNVSYDSGRSTYDLEMFGRKVGTVQLNVPGDHNVRNSLAAMSLAFELDIPFETAAAGLQKFRGVERRFQILGEASGAIVVDDYAHHPTEIRATLEAARGSYPSKRIVALFQPHLFSRTRDFFDGFAEALQIADLAFITQIYPAREEPIEGVTAELITEAASRRGTNITLLDLDKSALPDYFRGILTKGDLFITMGAGDVNEVAEHLAAGGKA